MVGPLSPAAASSPISLLFPRHKTDNLIISSLYVNLPCSSIAHSIITQRTLCSTQSTAGNLAIHRCIWSMILLHIRGFTNRFQGVLGKSAVVIVKTVLILVKHAHAKACNSRCAHVYITLLFWFQKNHLITKQESFNILFLQVIRNGVFIYKWIKNHPLGNMTQMLSTWTMKYCEFNWRQ